MATTQAAPHVGFSLSQLQQEMLEKEAAAALSAAVGETSDVAAALDTDGDDNGDDGSRDPAEAESAADNDGDDETDSAETSSSSSTKTSSAPVVVAPASSGGFVRSPTTSGPAYDKAFSAAVNRAVAAARARAWGMGGGGGGGGALGGVLRRCFLPLVVDFFLLLHFFFYYFFLLLPFRGRGVPEGPEADGGEVEGREGQEGGEPALVRRENDSFVVSFSFFIFFVVIFVLSSFPFFPVQMQTEKGKSYTL